jgi:hypothetical protein
MMQLSQSLSDFDVWTLLFMFSKIIKNCFIDNAFYFQLSEILKGELSSKIEIW